MRMIPVSTCRSLRDREYVIVLSTGRDRIKGTSVGIGGYVQTVPVNCSGLGQLVREVNDDAIAFLELEGGAGYAAVVGESIRHDSGLHLHFRGRGSEIHFNRVRRFGEILKCVGSRERNLGRRGACAVHVRLLCESTSRAKYVEYRQYDFYGHTCHLHRLQQARELTTIISIGPPAVTKNSSDCDDPKRH